MTTEIKTKENDSQTVGTAPNLGGPTSSYLAVTEILDNRTWAQRYQDLNRGLVDD